MPAPCVSVVMPVRDGGRFLDAAILSIRRQTLTDLELIMVDDGSTDGSDAILRRHASDDPRLTVLSQPPRGVATALNRGLAVARAELVARMDADDEAMPERLERQITALEARPEVAVLGCGMESIDVDGQVVGQSVPTDDPAEIREGLLQANYMAHPTVVMRRDLVLAAGSYRPVFTASEDYDLWLRMSERHDLSNLPDVAVMSAFDFFDDIWCINLPAHAVRWPVMQARLTRLGVGERVRRFPAVPSPADARIGRALSHRRIVQDAAERGLRSVLAIEDETLFLDSTEVALTAATAELRGRTWKLLHFGTWRGTDGLVAEPGCANLMQAGGRAGPHALAYGADGYAELLAAMPMSFGAMQDHLGADGSIDSILATLSPALVVHPAVATVPFSLPFQDPADQEHFVP